jgi:ketosteroid isomerase-like protein
VEVVIMIQRLRLVVLVAIAVTSASQAFADDQADVRSRLDKLYVALSARDMKSMGDVWAHDTTVMLANPRDKAPSVGWDAVQTDWQTVFSFWKEIKVAVTGTPTIVVDGDNAWAMYTNHADGATAEGKALSFNALTTDVLKKQNGSWLIVSHHASRIPE